MTYKIKIERELSDEFVADVMCTMVESGEAALWCWASPIDISRDDDLNVLRIEVREDTEEMERFVIDPVRVAEALQTLLDAPEPLCADYIMEYIRDGVAESDAGCIDAEAADVIAQVVCFGEVVYG